MLANAWVLNKSNHSIWVKPEHGNHPIEVKAGQKYPGEQDGLTIPYRYPKRVFKTCDQCSAIVGADDKLEKVECEGALSKTCQSGIGGWKTLNAIKYKPSWHALFSTSVKTEASE